MNHKIKTEENMNKENKKMGRRMNKTHATAGKYWREMKGIGYVVEQLIKYGEELSYWQSSKAEAKFKKQIIVAIRLMELLEK